jgi:tRNA G18 (ribose-2'-O)-methylase SpoU
VLGRSGRLRLAAVAESGDDYTTLDLTGPVAFVVGNEARGLPETLAGVDRYVTIPMIGPMESLNVGVATAVLCFEAARQSRVGAA